MSLHQVQQSDSIPSTSYPDSLLSMNGTSEEDQKMRFLREQVVVAQTVLQQAVDVLDNILTSDEQLSIPSQYLPGSTIGKHLRHADDHFNALLQVVKAQPSSDPYTLDYDRSRSRNSPMETSRAAASGKLTETIEKLGELVQNSSPNWDAPLVLHAITPYEHHMQSSLGRELWFASLHCVHHWSMVRVIVGELGITLSEDFGYAPSTLVHQGCDAPLGKAKI